MASRLIPVFCKLCQQTWEHETNVTLFVPDEEMVRWAIYDHLARAYPVPCEPDPVFVEYSRTG